MKKYYIDKEQEKFKQLDKQEQKQLLNWIKENFIPRKTINYNYTSYGLKHLIQHDKGMYTTNEQFKEAMILCGFKAGNTIKRSWNFNISEKKQSSFIRLDVVREEQKMDLKQEYNQTLKRYCNGCEYLMNNPNEWDKYEKVILGLLDKMNRILERIPDVKEGERLNGFKT